MAVRGEALATGKRPPAPPRGRGAVSRGSAASAGSGGVRHRQGWDSGRFSKRRGTGGAGRRAATAGATLARSPRGEARVGLNAMAAMVLRRGVRMTSHDPCYPAACDAPRGDDTSVRTLFRPGIQPPTAIALCATRLGPSAREPARMGPKKPAKKKSGGGVKISSQTPIRLHRGRRPRGVRRVPRVTPSAYETNKNGWTPLHQAAAAASATCSTRSSRRAARSTRLTTMGTPPCTTPGAGRAGLRPPRGGGGEARVKDNDGETLNAAHKSVKKQLRLVQAARDKLGGGCGCRRGRRRRREAQD